MRGIRSLIAFVLPALLGIVLMLLCMPLGRRRAINIAVPAVTWLGHLLAGIRLAVAGDVAALSIRPAVFVINHQSGADPIIVARLLRRNITGVAKKSLRRHPLLGPLLRLAGAAFVDRDAGAGSAALQPALARLKQGYGIVIAAEGRRSPDGRLLPFRPGALWLAREAGVPVVPIVLHNSRVILPPGALVMHSSTVAVTVLSPIPEDTITAGGLWLDDLEKRFVRCLDAGHPAIESSAGDEAVNNEPGSDGSTPGGRRRHH
ncbi:1-acyl-sn-glycerol-3-phosphate acyltransferase [Alcanivorax sp. JB21]|uniref:lysophospholipid acyltransferase family protein n=1 Tax=Alcanivorax limicola TaxID=2874102 RepID=UPI001CBAB78F|nr:lysophospholipid acyltransferase family protein [Alcanivorax limicola]MBZ2189774.1 1-acyl-sn-glycerol-3-phosphate acyltransferase [Alcanivorax limicola]